MFLLRALKRFFILLIYPANLLAWVFRDAMGMELRLFLVDSSLVYVLRNKSSFSSDRRGGEA